MTSPNEVKVGIVGAGYVSAYHIRALQTLPHVKIVGIADLDTARAAKLAEQFGIAGVYSSLSEMRAAQPDVIHVLTPPSSHCAIAIEALEMGCHVFVEKPMARTAKECGDMIAAARRAGRVLSVNHSASADPIVVEGLELLKKGVCGEVLAVDFCRSSDYPPYAGGAVPASFREGGYPFQDLGIHALCLMEAFLGVIGKADIRYRSTGTDPGVFFDEWRGIVECARGTGQFYLSWTARPMRNELFIHGTKGYMHLDCFLQTCTVHKALPGPKALQSSVDATLAALGALYKVPRNMVRFLTGRLRPSPGIHAGVLQFHDALARGVLPPTSMEDGQRLVALIEGVCGSADADRSRAFREQMPPPPARILVTGASGFLGSALLDRLRAQGEAVRVLARRPSSHLESLSGVHVVYGDLGDPKAVDRAVSGVDVVYHLGATMKGRGWPDFQAATVLGTTNMVESCLRHHVRKLVYVSSMTVLDYASHGAGTVVTETAPLEPHPEQRGFYTQAKLQAEKIVLDAVQRDGLPAVLLRPGQIFGRGAESVPPYGTLAIAGRWIVIGSGGLRLPLVYVEDVVDGLMASATRPAAGGSIFHLVDATPVTQNQYIEMCQKSGRGGLRVDRAPRPLLVAAGMAMEALGRLLHRSMPLSRYRVRSITELTFDCSKAETELGWRPSVGARAGLSATFDLAQPQTYPK